MSGIQEVSPHDRDDIAFRGRSDIKETVDQRLVSHIDSTDLSY